MKSYLNLKEEVWDKNICSGCGACVAVCPVENIYFKQQSPVKFECELCACTIDPTAESECPASAEFCKVTLYDVPCGACYDACPRTEEKVIPPVEEIGKYIEIFGAKGEEAVPFLTSIMEFRSDEITFFIKSLDFSDSEAKYVLSIKSFKSAIFLSVKILCS